MLTNVCNDNNSKNLHKYFCKQCDYSCSKKFLFTQHCSTKKHQNREMLANARKNMQNFTCDCGKQYKHQQSFNRHVKQCSKNKFIKNTEIEPTVIDNEKEELRDMVHQLLIQNKNMILANKEMREMVGEIIPKIGNNNTTTIHNKFNLNIFLNEECKDALNLTDFVNTLELKTDDLDNTRQHGFVMGITDILVKGLKQLDLNKRPIHCCDLKREVLYVKDNNTWERDDNKNTMKKAINNVAKKQIEKIKVWESTNPNWNKTDKDTTKYIEMIGHVTNTSLENNSENKIIKTIAKEVLLDKI